MEVPYTNYGLFLSQSKYAHDILSRTDLVDSKSMSTSMIPNQRLSADGMPFSNPTVYRSLVGALQYLTITRPNFTFAVNLVSQFRQSPTNDHFQTVNASFVMSKAQFPLVFTSQASLLPISLPSRMNIGPAIRILDAILLDTRSKSCFLESKK